MNLSLAALAPHLATFGLLLTRCTGTFLLIPTLGGETVPVRVRGAVAVMMTLALFSLVRPTEVSDPLALILASIGELVMGLCMGMVVRLALSVAEMAGELISAAIGLSFMQIVDPLTRENSPGLSPLLGALSILVLLAIDGHQAIIAGLGQSLNEAPLGTVLPRAAYAGTLLPLLGTTTTAGLRVAAPVVTALLLVNGALGLLARAAPQLNIFILSMGITVAAGMLVLVSSLPASLSTVVQELRAFPQVLGALLGD